MSTGSESTPIALDRRLSGLSPEKRRYLEQLLRQHAMPYVRAMRAFTPVTGTLAHHH